MKRILVPTAFSIYAENALKAAAQLAKKHKAEILLLHMLELPNQMSDAIFTGKSIPEVLFFFFFLKETFTEIFFCFCFVGIGVIVLKKNLMVFLNLLKKTMSTLL